MAARINIRKLLSFTMWCIVGAGVLVLLVAAIGYRNNKTCKGFKIDISGPGKKGDAPIFIGKKEILDMLIPAGHMNRAAGAVNGDRWVGRAMASFDLHHMEDVLEKNVWIRDAELFFDNNGILRVNVIEREPVARVFMTDGNSCYVDSSGIQLPLSDRLANRLPVFTGYPATPMARLHGDDSLTAVQVRKMAGYIRNDSFWLAQIEQVDVRADHTLQLVPTVGNHLVEFGDAGDYEQKLHRLFLFYKQVSSQAGWDKYSRIDVAYAGQVIGTRKGSEGTRQDSLQGMRNIQQMIHAAQRLEPDTARLATMKPLENPVMNEQALTSHDLIPDSAGGHMESASKPAVMIGSAAAAKPGAAKPVTAKPGIVKPGTVKPTGAKPKPTSTIQHNQTKPRAIMPKRGH